MHKHIAHFVGGALAAALALTLTPPSVFAQGNLSPFCDYINGFTLDSAVTLGDAVTLGQPPVEVVFEGVYSAEESFMQFEAVDDLLPLNAGEIITVTGAPLAAGDAAERQPEAVAVAALTATDGVVIRKLRAYNPVTGTSAGIAMPANAPITKIRVSSGNGIPMTVTCSLEPIETKDEAPDVVLAKSAVPEIDLTASDLPVSGLIGQFNHGDIVQVTPQERPQLTVQFGNSSQRPIPDISLACLMDGAATFTDQVAIHGAFATADQSDKGLSFGPPVPSINAGQNYNVTFAVNPVEGVSTVTCALTTPGFAPVVFTQAVGIR